LAYSQTNRVFESGSSGSLFEPEVKLPSRVRRGEVVQHFGETELEDDHQDRDQRGGHHRGLEEYFVERQSKFQLEIFTNNKNSSLYNVR
jgi:hypothetical protein